MYMYVCMYVCIYVYSCDINLYVCIYKHKCSWFVPLPCVYIQSVCILKSCNINVYVCMHIYIYIYIYIQSVHVLKRHNPIIRERIHVCMYLYLYVHTCVSEVEEYSNLFTYIHTCARCGMDTFASSFVCMYVYGVWHMYVCVWCVAHVCMCMVCGTWNKCVHSASAPHTHTYTQRYTNKEHTYESLPHHRSQ